MEILLFLDNTMENKEKKVELLLLLCRGKCETRIDWKQGYQKKGKGQEREALGGMSFWLGPNQK